MFVSGWGAEVNFSFFVMCVASIVFRLQTVRLHAFSFYKNHFIRTARLKFAQKLKTS